MARRELGQINAGSMADIAFLLLIFFLVTTTMDIDSGLSRKLPPMPEEEQEDTPPIKERNVFIVLLNRNNQLLVEGEPMNVNILRERAKEFIANIEDKDNLPDKKLTEIDYFGMYPVSKGIISLQNDRGTSYGTYIKVQNELVAAYNELRDELSLEKFGKKYRELTKDKMDAIRKVYPQRISEAEPKDVGKSR